MFSYIQIEYLHSQYHIIITNNDRLYFLTLVLFYYSECRSFCAKTMQYLTHSILFCFQILRPVYQDNQGTLGKTRGALCIDRSSGRS